MAHSNWVEIQLMLFADDPMFDFSPEVRRLLREVFPHVGANTILQVGPKVVYPLVTGTFGAADFSNR